MGIKELKRADGQISFEADVRIANVDRKIRTFDTREKAEKFISATTAAARKTLRASASNALDQPHLRGQRNFERAKLADVILAFLESPACSERAKRSLVRVPDFVGNITIAKADEEWSRIYLSEMRSRITPMGRPYALATIKEHLSYMKIVCRWWARRNKVANPFIAMSTECMPANWENKRDRRLEAGEYERVLAQINAAPSRQAHWRCLFILALETCARLQELVLAQWSELSHNDELWKIPPTHTKKKTSRAVPLSPRARGAIAELRTLKRDGDQRIFEVFSTPASVSHGFANIIRKAKVENFRFHDLRHDGISKKVLNCPPHKLPSLMKIVGHKDYASLMRYSHLLDDDVIGLFG